jgi:hypothetical protein
MHVVLTSSQIWQMILKSGGTVVFGAVLGMGVGVLSYNQRGIGTRVALTRFGIRVLSWALGTELLSFAFVSWVATQTFATCSHVAPIAAKPSGDMLAPVAQCLHPDQFYTGTPVGYAFMVAALAALCGIVYGSHRLLKKPNLITAGRRSWEETKELLGFVLQKANAYWSKRPTR